MDHSESAREAIELAALLAMLTLSDGDVAEALGVSPITVRSWRTGRRSPTAENRESLVAAARAHAQGILKLARELDERALTGAMTGQGGAPASSPEPI